MEINTVNWVNRDKTKRLVFTEQSGMQEQVFQVEQDFTNI